MKYDEHILVGGNRFNPDSISEEHIGFLRSIYTAVINAIKTFFRWVGGIGASAIILSILLFIVINFYIFSSIVNLNSFFYSFLLLSILVDGIYVLVHLPRSRVQHQKISFDPSKLTILIACYNGEKVLPETIKQASRHVPLNQIIVVSDASTDHTVQIAQNMGVQVMHNRRNMQKAFSVSIGMRAVRTPYVLLLDDDTLIGDIKIPTNLLDEGFSAVAFNVMPVKEKSLINSLQLFEYRQSMVLGKNVRAQAGAIGNISGAIGLYRTKDLIKQVTLHSGQFAGEDEQRTMLVHLHGVGKGITYTDETALTKAPSTYLSLYRQRAYSWSASVPELFSLYWRILLSPRYHFLLKAEKAYQLYIYLTDPLRMLFFWALFTKSSHLLIIYAFYLVLDSILWLKLRRKDSIRAVIFFPFYSLGLTVCRFIGYFYWIYLKFKYMSNKLYRYAQNRHLLYEYSMVFAVILVSWVISSSHFMKELNLLQKINSNHLEDISNNFNYEKTVAYGTVPAPAAPVAPADASYLLIPVDKGDTQRAIAYKAIVQYLQQKRDVEALKNSHESAYVWLSKQISPFDPNNPVPSIPVNKNTIEQALSQEGVKT